MAQEQGSEGRTEEAQGFSSPIIFLPSGGAAKPAAGISSLTVLIATSPGRSGFGPAPSLSCDSGAGNGPFGFGWNLSLPSITRITDKDLPQYRDTEQSDVFIFSSAEDLLPLLLENGGQLQRDLFARTVDGVDWFVRPTSLIGTFAITLATSRTAIQSPHSSPPLSEVATDGLMGAVTPKNPCRAGIRIRSSR